MVRIENELIRRVPRKVVQVGVDLEFAREAPIDIAHNSFWRLGGQEITRDVGQVLQPASFALERQFRIVALRDIARLNDEKGYGAIPVLTAVMAASATRICPSEVSY